MTRLQLVFVLGVSAACIAGCAVRQPETTTSAATDPEFSVLVAQDGRVIRANRRTGEIWVLEGSRYKPVQEGKTPQLLIGQTYLIEGNRSIRYLGDGRFTEPVKDFRRLWD